jgi:hypothetical protein
VLTILLAVCILINLLSIFSSYQQLELISRVIDGAQVTSEEITANDARQAMVLILWGLVFFVTGVTFLVWMYRAYRNLEALGNIKERLDFSAGWAVGSFFVPFINLVYPFQAMREIWNKSDPKVRNADELAWQVTSYTPPLIIIWWLVWLASNVTGHLHRTFADDAKTPETILWVTQFGIIADLIAIGSAILAILVVRGVKRRQEERSQHVRFVESLPPPPPLYAQQPGGFNVQR